MVVGIGGSGVRRTRCLEVVSKRTRVTVCHVRVWLLLGQQILQLEPVVGPDFLAQFVEYFPNGERLLGRPGDGDFDSDWTAMTGGWAHDLVPRRLRARASARSRASLRR